MGLEMNADEPVGREEVHNITLWRNKNLYCSVSFCVNLGHEKTLDMGM
jgi:hypothetical protein